MAYAYQMLPCQDITPELLAKCATLFSEHYGTWAESGKRVKLSPKLLTNNYLFDKDTCFLVTATFSATHTLVGHAFACRFHSDQLNGYVTWVTQLVVHANHRKKGVASKLCHAVWQTNEDVASGLVTSHPYAIRALEAAVRRKCDIVRARAIANHLIEQSKIPYLQKCQLLPGRCVLNTEVKQCINQQGKNWKFGDLPDGCEFFAFSFYSSPVPVHHEEDKKDEVDEATSDITQLNLANHNTQLVQDLQSLAKTFSESYMHSSEYIPVSLRQRTIKLLSHAVKALSHGSYVISYI